MNFEVGLWRFGRRSDEVLLPSLLHHLSLLISALELFHLSRLGSTARRGVVLARPEVISHLEELIALQRLGVAAALRVPDLVIAVVSVPNGPARVGSQFIRESPPQCIETA